MTKIQASCWLLDGEKRHASIEDCNYQTAGCQLFSHRRASLGRHAATSRSPVLYVVSIPLLLERARMASDNNMAEHVALATRPTAGLPSCPLIPTNPRSGRTRRKISGKAARPVELPPRTRGVDACRKGCATARRPEAAASSARLGSRQRPADASAGPAAMLAAVPALKRRSAHAPYHGCRDRSRRRDWALGEPRRSMAAREVDDQIGPASQPPL